MAVARPPPGRDSSPHIAPRLFPLRPRPGNHRNQPPSPGRTRCPSWGRSRPAAVVVAVAPLQVACPVPGVPASVPAVVLFSLLLSPTPLPLLPSLLLPSSLPPLPPLRPLRSLLGRHGHPRRRRYRCCCYRRYHPPSRVTTLARCCAPAALPGKGIPPLSLLSASRLPAAAVSATPALAPRVALAPLRPAPRPHDGGTAPGDTGSPCCDGGGACDGGRGHGGGRIMTVPLPLAAARHARLRGDGRGGGVRGCGRASVEGGWGRGSGTAIYGELGFSPPPPRQAVCAQRACTLWMVQCRAGRRGIQGGQAMYTKKREERRKQSSSYSRRSEEILVGEEHP